MNNIKMTFNARELPYIPKYDEILRKIQNRYKKLKLKGKGWKGRKRLELERIELVYNIVKSEIEKIINTSIYLDTLHPFYGELIKLLIDYDEYRNCIESFKKSLKVIRTLYTKYHSLVKSKRPNIEKVKEQEFKRKLLSSYYAEIKRLRREAIGRILSVIKRRRKCLEVIKKSYISLRKIPSIDAEAPSIIIAGMPQVGKSTLVSKISTAKPEIAPYPFTTKSIIIGHIKIKRPYEILIQVIDTPGLLDRPLSERNKIELQAILALRHLKGAIIYLLDASISRYYSFEEQINVLREIMETFRDKKIYIALNKIDRALKKDIDQVYEKIRDLGIPEDRVFLISALHGYNIDKLMNSVLKKIVNL